MKEAMLYNKEENGDVQCYLCRRMCKIKPGETGYCHVRKNIDGTLYSLPYGKAVAVNVDPIEKKPFYHFMPGRNCFSFSTVGCNYRCLNCFPPGTIVLNDFAPKPIEQVFEESEKTDNGEIRLPKNKKTVSANGEKENLNKSFEHEYRGKLVGIKPYYTPPLECTPNHPFFVWNGEKIVQKEAGELGKGDYLVVPKIKSKNKRILYIPIEQILGGKGGVIQKSRKTDEQTLRKIMRMKERGCSSREIGKRFGMHPVYLRKLIGEIKAHGINKETFLYSNTLVKRNGGIKFRSENKGIPTTLPLDEELAELLGYYVAEGTTARNTKRPNSFQIIFSFGKSEGKLAKRTKYLVEKIFRLDAKISTARTTTVVTLGSSSLGILLKELCGTRAIKKKIPEILFKSPKKVILAYLKAYIAGDGTNTIRYIAMNTVSKELAIGTYSLLLMMGWLPAFYKWVPPKTKKIEGREVNQSPLYYVKIHKKLFGKDLLGEKNVQKRKGYVGIRFRDCGDFWAIPIHKIWKREYSGPVYNMEVENEHSYLANFVGVHNCQNWEISQAYPGIIGEEWSPERINEYCAANKIPGIAYTYTEPTVFMEYALDTAKLAHQQDVFNVFVTNGYMSDAAISEMKGRIDASRIDLKGFKDHVYKDVCGGVELEGVLATIKGLYKIGHIEIINLVIPGYNDDEDDIRALSNWVKELDPNIPMHFIGFYPANKMMDVPATKLETLLKAREIALDEGIKFAYTGNRMNWETESTYCPKCGELVIKRLGFEVLENKIEGYNKCPCGEEIYMVNEIGEYWKRNGKRDG